jgi:predicted transcriptional regulator
MAKALGVSAGYVNLLENNERSLSLRILMAVADNYGVNWQQFVELPDGDRFFTISRTVDRPTVNFDTQDHRLAISLGCELKYAKKLGYAAAYNHDDERIFSRIGINCHVCPRQACSQRAHQPFFMDLPLDTNRRGKTRYES